MPDHILLLKIAKDEIKTLIQYSEMLASAEVTEDIKRAINEVMGDEFNHALISMLLAAQVMDIKIATDDISPDPNKIEVQ